MLFKRLLDLGIVELEARLSVVVVGGGGGGDAVHSVELVVVEDSLRIVLELFIGDVIDVFKELLDLFFLSTSFSTAFDSFDLLNVFDFLQKEIISFLLTSNQWRCQHLYKDIR